MSLRAARFAGAAAAAPQTPQVPLPHKPRPFCPTCFACVFFQQGGGFILFWGRFLGGLFLGARVLVRTAHGWRPGTAWALPSSVACTLTDPRSQPVSPRRGPRCRPPGLAVGADIQGSFRGRLRSPVLAWPSGSVLTLGPGPVAVGGRVWTTPVQRHAHGEPRRWVRSLQDPCQRWRSVGSRFLHKRVIL